MLGDRPLIEYPSSDSAMYRHYLLKRGVNTASAKRKFSTIRSIINLTIQEHGLDCRNALSKIYLPELDDVNKESLFLLRTSGGHKKTVSLMITFLTWALSHIHGDA